MNNRIPLYQKLIEFTKRDPISFHVPGHKNGEIFPLLAQKDFASILKLDMTEIPGLDDLHAPTEAIAEAETGAARFFGADHTFFLVGGSTAGNLAMILSVCRNGEKVIVQQNSHKSIMNGLELCNAKPIFLAPEYDQHAGRYTNPSLSALHQTLQEHPDAKAIMLTYPDYFGKTYPLREMIDLAHTYNIPVLVDEAHGVHFSLGSPLPPSALKLGADAVVQSAHKMAPAMTMASYLHLNSTLLSKQRVAHFLQMIQSSSPSYPLMVSLDLARYFLESFTKENMEGALESVQRIRRILNQNTGWHVLEQSPSDDPFKTTLQINPGYTVREQAALLEENGIYPELTTHNQLLMIHGLLPFQSEKKLEKTMKKINEKLKKDANHATIEIGGLFTEKTKALALSYEAMNERSVKKVPLRDGVGHIAAEAIIPYPPGIPIVLKGEKVKQEHIDGIEHLIDQGIRIQQREDGLKIFSEDSSKESQ